LHNTFYATQSYWTNHCGIVALSTDINITQLKVLNDDCHIFVRVKHTQNDFQPFFILTLYAPATSPKHRQLFYNNLYHSTIFDHNQPYHQCLIITGDFNYSY
ncbi:hypothetical protein BDC45DRAFT_448778, partial [Circinella umbellata]